MLELPGAMISKVTTLSDRTVRIQLDLREMSPEDTAKLFDQYLKNKEGIAIEMPEVIPEDNGKSMAQRLRGILYRMWEMTNRAESNETYYRRHMEMICDSLKTKYLP